MSLAQRHQKMKMESKLTARKNITNSVIMVKNGLGEYLATARIAYLGGIIMFEAVKCP